MGKKHEFKVSTGITSIMMIFVVLCLTAFGVLSYTSANADNKLTDKNSKHIQEYYSAEAQLYERLEKLDGILVKVPGDDNDSTYFDAVYTAIKSSGLQYDYNAETHVITFKQTINDNQILVMDVEIKAYSGSDRYEVKSIKTI